VVIGCLLATQVTARDVVFEKSRLVLFSEDSKGNWADVEKKAKVVFGDSIVIVTGYVKMDIGEGRPQDVATDRHTIPYSSVTYMEYERSTHSRVAAAILLTPWALLSKRKHHWFTIQYTPDGDSTSTSVLIQLDKREEKPFRRIARDRVGVEVTNLIE
jgi:hypothetical protein